MLYFRVDCVPMILTDATIVLARGFSSDGIIRFCRDGGKVKIVQECVTRFSMHFDKAFLKGKLYV